MSTVAEAATALYDALSGVDGLRAYHGIGPNVDPPGAIVTPPRLSFDSQCSGPNEAQFIVHVAVARDDRAVERLWELVPQVVEAISQVEDAVVKTATPAIWPNSGSGDLPSYAITVEVAL